MTEKHEVIFSVPQLGKDFVMTYLLLARDYKPSLVDKQFQEVSKITRAEAGAKRPKNKQISKIKFSTTYNLSLPKINGIIRKHLPLFQR